MSESALCPAETRQPAARQAWSPGEECRSTTEGATNRGLVNDRRYARRWTAWFGRKNRSALSIEALRQHQAKLRAKMKINTKTQQPQRLWANATINRHYAFLRHILMLAVKDGKLTQNPVSSIKFFAEEQRTRFLTDGGLRLLEQIMAPHDWQFVLFAIETELRREEQFRLRWDQVDLGNGVVTIPMPKGGRTRHVPLSHSAPAILRSLDSFVRSPWVFPTSKHPLQPQNPQSFINNVYSVALRKAGIIGANWHSLRHTAASRRIMAGVDFVSVKEILGHRDVATTMRYSHLSPTHLRQAVNMGSLGNHLRTISPPDIQAGTGTKTGTAAPHNMPVPSVISSQVVDLMGETTWLGNEGPSLSSQFKNPKSKHAPIVRFLDKEHPHC